MVDMSLTHSSSGGDNSRDADIEGLSTDLPSIQSPSGGYTSHSERYSSPDAGAISGNLVAPIKAITAVPISRLAFPFNLTIPSPRRQPTPLPTAPPPSRRTTYVPSPLGAREGEGKPKARPPSRGSYRTPRHHGHSRQALLHTKWLWSSRGEELKHKSDNSETVSPPLGSPSTKSPKTTDDSHCIRAMRTLDCHDDPKPSLVPPPTIYPRRGELGGLRDSYCVEADRCFANVPIWTLAKVLWVHDMHALCAPRVPTPTEDDGFQSQDEEDFDESASEVSFDTTTSLGFSDDSESTLVDSETEWDSQEEPVAKGVFIHDSPVSSRVQSTSSLQSESEPSASLGWAKDVYLKPLSTSQLSRSLNRPANWYRRWEVLLELSHSDKRPEKSPPPTPRLPVKDILKIIPPKPSAPVKRLSFTRGFLTGLKKANAAIKPAPSYAVQHSFLEPSHPAAG